MIQTQKANQALQPKTGGYRWTICALLFFATTVNYLDRQVLSLLQPMLADRFGWSNTQYANIAAVFQLTYAFSMLFAGRVIDKMGTRKGYAWAMAIWSLAAMLHAYAEPLGRALSPAFTALGFTAIPVSVLGFMVARALLGFGESGNFPAAIKATAEYFPEKERSLATGLFNSGANVGALLAPLTVPWVASLLGWESTFIVIGALGFVWLYFWFGHYDTPARQTRLSDRERAYRGSDSEAVPDASSPSGAKKVPWLRLLGLRQTWAFVCGKFLTNGVWWFFLFWLPAFLKAQYGLAGTQVMLPLGVLYSMTMLGSIFGGWFPMYFIRQGYNPYEARLRAMFLIALFPLLVLAAQPLGHLSYWFPVLFIGIGASAHQAWSANIFTTVSDMFPKNSVASVTGIGGMAGGLSGVVVTKIGGYLFDYYEKAGQAETGYTFMFAYCALAYLLAWAVMKSLVPRMKPVLP